MKAAIFNPYWDTLGGGEKYTISFAKVLLSKGYEVDIEWHETGLLTKLQNRFGVNTEGIRVLPDVKRGDGYDVCFWVSDGSLPLLKARNNLLHFQVPFKDVGGKSLLNKMKLFRINKIICNSVFTKKIIDDEFGVQSLVIYPPVETSAFKPRRKENLILSVGRFSNLLQSKRHDVLTEVFKSFYDRGIKDWKLVLAGGTEIGTDEYLKKLKEEVKGYPVKILESPGIESIKELYGKAKIYWSASGFEIDTVKEPKKAEHFGITLIEAMSAAAVPLAFNAGGFKEIIIDNENGFLWNSKEELSNKTLELINDKRKLNSYSKKAVAGSKNFSFEVFRHSIEKLL
jgi:glycosyltransferase involved in cell wall biosynthesis